MIFQSLLDHLPDCPGSVELPIRQDPGGFRYIEHGLPEFIGPDLSPSSQLEQSANPRIMIISAAGAVGKSTLAREVARHKRAPIWDLAQAAAVGGNSMTGQLTASFGFELAGQVSKQLAGGDLFLIVDALDEARVRANEAGFKAFIDNIGGIANGASGTPFVLLARTQTAETTWLLLDDVGVHASLVSIQPFTRDQATQYIDKRIQYFDASAARRIAEHPQPFVEARDLILNHLERAVREEESINDGVAHEFLGYAPVLETVAVLLARERNYRDFVANFSKLMGKESVDQMDRPLAVLEHVVTRLLEREQHQKLQRNIRPELERVATQAGWDNWEILYSPDEQRTRLLGLILGQKYEACPSMPDSVRARYEEQLEVCLPEHPFLREGSEPANKVFESYLFAIAMREYLTPLSHDVERRVGASEYKPSRLLADFYILLGEQRETEEVAERQIGLLYDSLLAGETDSLRVRLSVTLGDPDETEDEDTEGEGEFELVYTAREGEEQEQIERRSFKIVAQEGLIAFTRQLREAVVVTRGTVMLGGHVDDFEIGPSVDIRCTKLEICSTGFVVRSGRGRSQGAEGVVLEASTCNSMVLRKPVIRGSLAVSWAGAQGYPWSDFAFESGHPEATNQQLHEAYRRFGRIVRELRSHGKGGLAKFQDKIEHQRVLKGKAGRAILDKLLEDGIMVLKGRLYHWVPERADQLLRVSHENLRRRRPSDELTAYLERIIADHPDIF